MLNYLELTKPRISLLFAFTGFAALVIEGSLFSNFFSLFLLTLAIFLVGGSANSFNQYLERDLDKQMERTAKKRPLPLGKIRPLSALLFSIVIGILGLLILYVWGGKLSAFIGLATILFYSFYYTLWLKPKTPYNIVMGGAGGAAGPLIGWSAIQGTLSWEAWTLFLIVFFWTPPHFWALALTCKEDYKKVSLPMFPLVKGDEATRKQIFYYSLILLPLSLCLIFSEKMGILYGTISFVLGSFFLWFSFLLLTRKTDRQAKILFGYSILYLMLLFVVIVLDALY